MYSHRMAGDGDVVVVDQHFHIQALCATVEAGGLGVVAFHLTAVGAEHHDRAAGARHRDAVAEGPHVPKTARAELDARREVLLGVARQAAVELAIVEQLLCGHVPVEDAEEVLRRDAMACLVVHDRHDRRAARDERADDQHLGHRVVRAAGVAREAARASERREEDDRVATELHVERERLFLRGRERRLARVERERTERAEVDRERVVGHRAGTYQETALVAAARISAVVEAAAPWQRKGMEPKRLYRSNENRMIAGVCGGLGEYFGIDPTIIRVIAFFLLLPGGLPGFLPYVVFWAIVPRDPR